MDNRSSKPDGTSRPTYKKTANQRTPAPAQPTKKTKRASNNRWGRAAMMVLATVIFCGFLAVFILQSALDMFGLNQKDELIEVTIPEDPSLSQIASILSKAGVIDQRLTFQLYAGIKQDDYYHGGDYIFNSNMGYDEILSDLRTSSVQDATVKITFVEGANAYEIATQLEEEGVCSADEFLENLENTDFGYTFMDDISDSDLRFRHWEGYLFPDTYEFYVGENVDSVARRFFDNFSTKITAQMKERMEELGITLDETITLASMIQKEAGGVHGIDEMKRVSSVFHNRLNTPEAYPKLQSDVTREYVNRFIKPFLDYTNQEMYDAYNTYACDGLPVGPICSPSEDAIQAALYPTQSNNYFFVTDVNENFYYAETIDEHSRNVAKSQSVEGEGEIHGTDTIDE